MQLHSFRHVLEKNVSRTCYKGLTEIHSSAHTLFPVVFGLGRPLPTPAYMPASRLCLIREGDVHNLFYMYCLKIWNINTAKTTSPLPSKPRGITVQFFLSVLAARIWLGRVFFFLSCFFSCPKRSNLFHKHLGETQGKWGCGYRKDAVCITRALWGAIETPL